MSFFLNSFTRRTVVSIALNRLKGSFYLSFGLIRFNSLNPEARLSQQLSLARKAVDLDHLLLNGLLFKFHSKFRQIC